MAQIYLQTDPLEYMLLFQEFMGVELAPIVKANYRKLYKTVGRDVTIFRIIRNHKTTHFNYVMMAMTIFTCFSQEIKL